MSNTEKFNELKKELKGNGENKDTRNICLVIALCNSNANIAWKTKKYYNDEAMNDESFLAGINTPLGAISFQLDMKYWDILNIPEIDKEPEYNSDNNETVNERLLTVGNLAVFSNMDSEFINRLFRYVVINSDTLYTPYESVNKSEEDFHDHDIIDAFKNALPGFLDVIVAYAEKHNLQEFLGLNGSYTDESYYYIVRYNDITLKIGLIYEGNVVFITSVDRYEEEDVINCEDVFKELTVTNESKEGGDGSKGLSFKPSNKNINEEENK